MKSICYLIISVTFITFASCYDSKVRGEGSQNVIGLTQEQRPWIVYYSAIHTGHEEDIYNYTILKYAFLSDNGWQKEIIDNRAWVPLSFDSIGSLPEGKLVKATVNQSGNPIILYPFGEDNYLFKIAQKNAGWTIDLIPVFGNKLSREFQFIFDINYNGLPNIFFYNFMEEDNFSRNLKYLYYDGALWRDEVIDHDISSIRKLVLEDNKIWILYSTEDKARIGFFDSSKWEIIDTPLGITPFFWVDFDSQKHLQGIYLTSSCGLNYTHWDPLISEYTTEKIKDETDTSLIHDDFLPNLVQFDSDNIYVYFVCRSRFFDSNSVYFVSNFIYKRNQTWSLGNLQSKEIPCDQALSFYLTISNGVKFLCEKDGELKIFNAGSDGWSEENRFKICLNGGSLADFSVVIDSMKNLHMSFSCVKSWTKYSIMHSEVKLYYLQYNGEIVKIELVDE